ncbi:hypothetical protein SAMN04489859_102040 [Paracoccus alcaliphilus]|uniref:Uncharacterized protein n=1 Tax=Paracoccus alcaliphilus TaxID=34002 RepID=A0A1H8K4B9_9RHOB|nr:hypothetical protein [Paracoccus alcaliphilus]WCR17536.1 hypothetical protein JHW40_14540 [Paracoccus alcaliphilus]SEN87611.1 hypothetical protein SAMN04489859_102040 [Paracoccus alcaliphilus]
MPRRIEATNHFQYHDPRENRAHPGAQYPEQDTNRGHIALGLTIVAMILGWGAFFLWVLL